MEVSVQAEVMQCLSRSNVNSDPVRQELVLKKITC
jgi:hypothetical protein